MHKETINTKGYLQMGFDDIEDQEIDITREFIAHEIVRRGYDHSDFCEDFSYTNSDSNLFFGAVFDGCSSGVASHFASTLFSKVLSRQIELYNSMSTTGDHFITGRLLSGAKEILYRTFQQVQSLKTELDLDNLELLSTIILMVHDKKSRDTVIIAIGDGFININGERTDIDQENAPDYLAHQLDNLHNKEEFVTWIQEYALIFEGSDVEDVSICSDGITSFMSSPKVTPEQDYDPIQFLTEDDRFRNNKAMFGKKCNLLKNKGGLYHMDDLSIVRVINKRYEA